MTVAHYPQARGRAPVRRVPGRWLPLLAFLAGLAACSSSPSQPGDAGSRSASSYAQATADSRRANEVLVRAISLVGTPYRYGGNTPAGGFDCSGLVGYVFLDAAGVRLPRSTSALMDLKSRRIARGDLQPGDLVLFTPSGGGHVGIYVGEGRFVHAPSSGGTVRMDKLDTPYWARAYAGAKRVLD